MASIFRDEECKKLLSIGAWRERSREWVLKEAQPLPTSTPLDYT